MDNFLNLQDSNIPPVEKASKKGWKILFAIVAIIILVLAPITVYVYLNFNKKSSKQVDNYDMENISVLSSATNVNDYIKNIQIKIDQTTGDKTQNDIYKLRKAIALSLNRNDKVTENYTEATDILVNLINTNQGSDQTSQYLRAYSTLTLVKLHNECCSSSETSDSLFNNKIQGYNSKYFSLIKSGYSKDLAKFLSLKDLLATIPANYSLDITYRSTSMDLSSRILANYGPQLKSDDKQLIINSLSEDLGRMSEYKPLTYKNLISTEVFPKAIYAFAYDIYHQNTSDLNSYNSQINQNYQFVDTLTPDNIGLSVDPISLNEIKYFNILRYFYSIHDRYGKNTSPELVNKLIEETLQIINSSEELKSVASNNFKSNDTKTGVLKGHAYFISLRSKYKPIDDYLKSINL